MLSAGTLRKIRDDSADARQYPLPSEAPVFRLSALSMRRSLTSLFIRSDKSKGRFDARDVAPRVGLVVVSPKRPLLVDDVTDR